ATLRYARREERWSLAQSGSMDLDFVINHEVVEQMHAALERPHSRYPINLTTGLNFVLPHLAPLKKAAQYLALEAVYAAGRQDSEQATQAVLATLSAAHTLAEEPLFVSYLSRIELSGLAIEAAEVVLSRTELTADQLRRMQTAFVSAEDTNHLGRAIAGDRVAALESLHIPSRTLFKNVGAVPGYWQNLFQARVLDVYDLCGLRQRDAQFHLDRLDELAEIGGLSRTLAPGRQRQLAARLNAVAGPRDWLHPVARQESWLFQPILPTELRSVATLRCAQTAMAVQRWRLAHDGTLPASLEALVPEYLATLPEDPLDGQSLKLRAQTPGYVIYSVGDDGADGGGKKRAPKSNQQPGRDYTFTVTR
ncbi:MAG TPA: hypothetical protein VMB21_09765, partial [Candidatus Limnocylindria bacterium]|nr:hypothetical protein [Candidatus Limnocylindria bacterium]